MLLMDHFFSLEEFNHKFLWKEDEPIWFPLVVLDEYLEEASYKIEIEIPGSLT